MNDFLPQALFFGAPFLGVLCLFVALRQFALTSRALVRRMLMAALISLQLNLSLGLFFYLFAITYSAVLKDDGALLLRTNALFCNYALPVVLLSAVSLSLYVYILAPRKS